MHVEDILLGMRSGAEQPDHAIRAFVEGVVDGSISRPQAAAWLAWAFARGLTTRETVALTVAMTNSGDTMAWPDGARLVDKHSTGGVGDKVSLILAPLWASLGLRVPMISGRGLGHTGGTLDKLEAIPGYRTDLSDDELRGALDDVGAFISGQTAQLAPADRILYALRNEVQAVASIPLIVGSILSKKLAEGVEDLVLDVKVGSGAFMKDLDAARALARALVDVATGAGVRCRALLTEMNTPLGVTVGNALEVRESVDCLKGGGPADLRDLVVALADHPEAAAALDDGRAYAAYEAMVRQQGGDPDAPLHGAGCREHVITAERAGVVARMDALAIGRAAFQLGAGRRRAEDPVDFGVGLEVLAKPGDAVDAGQPLLRVWHRDGYGLDSALGEVAAGVTLSDGPVVPAPLIHEEVTAS